MQGNAQPDQLCFPLPRTLPGSSIPTRTPTACDAREFPITSHGYENTDAPKLPSCNHGEKNPPRTATTKRSVHGNGEVSPASEAASLLRSPGKHIRRRQLGRAQTTPCKLLANSPSLALQKLRFTSAVVGFLGSLRKRDARCGTHW